jgi:hypothetical protein
MKMVKVASELATLAMYFIQVVQIVAHKDYLCKIIFDADVK